jgi:hypothetical protein
MRGILSLELLLLYLLQELQRAPSYSSGPPVEVVVKISRIVGWQIVAKVITSRGE